MGELGVFFILDVHAAPPGLGTRIGAVRGRAPVGERRYYDPWASRSRFSNQHGMACDVWCVAAATSDCTTTQQTSMSEHEEIGLESDASNK